MIAFLLLAIAEAFLIYSFVLIQMKRELQIAETVALWFSMQSFWCVGVGWWLALSLTA